MHPQVLKPSFQLSASYHLKAISGIIFGIFEHFFYSWCTLETYSTLLLLTFFLWMINIIIKSPIIAFM